MERKYATMDITYDLQKDEFKVKGDLNPEGRVEILESFIRSQVFGAGEDPTSN